MWFPSFWHVEPNRYYPNKFFVVFPIFPLTVLASVGVDILLHVSINNLYFLFKFIPNRIYRLYSLNTSLFFRFLLISNNVAKLSCCSVHDGNICAAQLPIKISFLQKCNIISIANHMVLFWSLLIWKHLKLISVRKLVYHPNIFWVSGKSRESWLHFQITTVSFFIG